MKRYPCCNCCDIDSAYGIHAKETSHEVPCDICPVAIAGVVDRFLQRHGLRITRLGEFILPTLGLMVMVLVAWAFLWVVA